MTPAVYPQVPVDRFLSVAPRLCRKGVVIFTVSLTSSARDRLSLTILMDATMVEQLLSSFSLVAVYLTLESSHRTLGYLRVRLLHGRLSSRPVRGLPPSPFFPIAPGAPSRYFRREGWEAREFGPHNDEVKYILRSSSSPVLRLLRGGDVAAWYRRFRLDIPTRRIRAWDPCDFLPRACQLKQS